MLHHVYAEADGADTFDALVWLGTHRSDQAGRLVRLVQYRHGDHLHRSVTNVLGPAEVSLAEIVELYGRRWDIKLAVKLIKRDLGLHLVDSARSELIQTQVWGVLLTAQIALELRRQVAAAAGGGRFRRVAATAAAGPALVGAGGAAGRVSATITAAAAGLTSGDGVGAAAVGLAADSAGAVCRPYVRTDVDRPAARSRPYEE